MIPRTTHPGMTLATVSWTLLHQLANKKMYPGTCPLASLMEAIPQLRVLHPRIQFCLLRLPKFCPIKRPRQFLYSTNESNTNT
ncbi:hypothetical protein LEMLEM_LOCUS12281, partial [Lemmus lemmus]